MRLQKKPTQKTFVYFLDGCCLNLVIAVVFDSITINLLGSNRQFDWIEIYLAYDKSDKYTTIYDSYNIELAAKYIQSVKLSNFTEIYNLIYEQKYDLDNCCTNYLLPGAVTAAARLH